MKLNNIASVNILAAICVLALTSCTPGDIQYCRGFGVEGTPEFGKCMNYYNQQEAIFNTDVQLCNMEADGTYPPSLYDYGHDVHVAGGYGPYGWVGGRTERIPPDYMHNRQVDDLRMRIIAPCMQARGWNSPNSWQAGRHAVSAPKKVAPAKMPWQ